MSISRPYRAIISGGGTGGHIYPAIAIAREIKRRHSDSEILFVGALGKMEMEKVPEAGFQIVGLPIRGLQRKFTLQNLLLPFRVFKSIRKCKKILKEFDPEVAIGVGGYASAPVLYLAQKRSIPTLIQEQNAFAGMANKWLGKNASRICVATEGMEKYFPENKIVVTGNPVRPDISLNIDRNTALEAFNLKGKSPVILVIGGSLGARTLNDSIGNGQQKIKQAGLQLIWQTGKLYYDEFRDRDQENHRVLPFISNMDKAYAAADVVISRAGALSVSELSLIGKPVIFVPSPNVAEDHQTKNAALLAGQDAAVLISDKEAREKLVDAAMDLLKNNDRRQQLSENIRKWARPDATSAIVNEIESLIL